MSKSEGLLRVTIAYVIALFLGGASLYLLDHGPLLDVFIADLVATAVIFVFSRAYGNSSFYDAYWSVVPPFIALYWLAVGAGSSPPLRELLVLGLILYWATRLTLNWAYYWEGMQHEDWRYVMLRNKAPRWALLTDLVGIHLFPTLQVFAGLLPVYAVYCLGDRPFGWLDVVACVITGGIGAFSPRPMPAGTGWEGKGLVYFVPRMEEFRDQDVVIVGGGDSAFDWASMLHPVARSIRIVHRREQFRAHGSMVEKVRELGVALHTPCEVTGVEGGDRIASVDITSKTTGLTETVPADTVIAALGFIANIGPIANWGLELDKRHIKVGTTMATSLPRVFAAGDIAVYPGKVALISVGFGEAAIAVNNAAPIIDPGMGIFPGHSSGESN